MIKVPKIEFHFSWIHNQIFCGQTRGKCFKIEEVQKFMKSLEKTWKKFGPKILRQMSNLTGLKWQEEKIVCYVIGNGPCYSDPLTIRVMPQKRAKRVLIHELTHRIICQKINGKKVAKIMPPIGRKYKKESLTTQHHILVYLIWHLLYQNKVISKSFWLSERESIFDLHKSKDYMRAWEIAEKELDENLIKL